jgi:hypothetical protein
MTMPAPTDEKGIKAEIETCYSTTDWTAKKALLNACVKAAQFLATGVKDIETLLDSLELAIQNSLQQKLNLASIKDDAKEAGKRHFDAAANYWQKKDRNPPPPNESPEKIKARERENQDYQNRKKADQAYRKLASDEIYKVLSVVPRFKKAVPTFVTFVQTAQFNANLRDLKHWKDPGVSPDHGEFTHQLQWYCLVKRPNPNLGLEFADFFEQLGTVEVKGTTLPSGYLTGNGLGLWEIVFDRGAAPFPYDGNSAVGPTDFRRPDNLLAHILKKRDTKYPLLGSFLHARQQKRLFELASAGKNKTPFKVHFDKYNVTLSEDNVWTVQYLLRKRFGGRSLDQLSDKERNQLFDDMVRAILNPAPQSRSYRSCQIV